MSLAQVTAFWLSFGEEGKVGSDLGGARLSLSCTDGKLPTETPRTQRLVRKRSGTKIPFYVPFYTILQFLRIFGEYSLVEVQLLATINSTARTVIGVTDMYRCIQQPWKQYLCLLQISYSILRYILTVRALDE